MGKECSTQALLALAAAILSLHWPHEAAGAAADGPRPHEAAGAAADGPRPHEAAGAAADGPSANDVPAAPRLSKAPRLVRGATGDDLRQQGKAVAEGSVLLKLVIDSNGVVEKATVMESGGPELDAVATEAAMTFLFEPGEIDGKPSRLAIDFRYDFGRSDRGLTLGVFRGTVREQRTGSPLEGVTIHLGSGESTVTDEQGKFAFEHVSTGPVVVTVSGAGMPDTITEENIIEGQSLDVEYSIERAVATDGPRSAELDDFELVVYMPMQKQVVATEVSSDQARRVAGASGDVARVVENLPGVARVNAGTNQLVVWGAAPGDTRTYVDGVRIPMLYHSGGVRSVFLSGEVANVALIPGSYATPYGRGIGGLVAVTLTPLKAAGGAGTVGSHGSVNADIIDVAANVSSDVSRRTRVTFSARQSYLDELLPLASSGVSDAYPIPRYRDAMARIGYRWSDDTTVHAVALYSTDHVRRTASSADSKLDRSQEQDLDFGRLFATVETRTKDGSVIRYTPWVGFDRSRQANRFAGIETFLESSSTWVGVRASQDSRIEEWLSCVVGIDAEFASSRVSRAGALALPSREGDIRVFGQPPSDQVSQDIWTTQFGSAAPFAEFDIHGLGDRLHIVPGLRIDPHVVAVDKRAPIEGDNPPRGAFRQSIVFEPRLSARYAVEPRVTFKFGTGLYHQPPNPEDLSAIFGNPKLAPARATHLLGGVVTRLTREISIDATVFSTWADAVTVRNPSMSPLAAEALISSGNARSRGAQVLLRKELSSRWFGWVAYSLVRSQRRSGEGAPWRLSDFDQTHSLTAVASYDLGYGFDIGARARVASGFPRTPVVGTYYDSRRDLYQPKFGQQNSERIPMFLQLDVRLTKRFRLGSSTLEAYLDVQNLTNRKNPEEVVYNAAYDQKRYITGLPILPVLGVNLQW